jgi:hypothetical protein
MKSYDDFLKRKVIKALPSGLKNIPDLNPSMFGYQKDVTEFLLTQGRGAAFLDTGMGKSFIELEYGRVIAEHTNKPVIMFAPLAVGAQHVREANRFGIEARTVKTQDDIGPGVNIANYERIHLFEAESFGAFIGDESGIIKNYSGMTTRKVMEFVEKMPFRLLATATPAPNDHMELGQHCQALGVMDSSEMLARWFITDQSEMGKYRIKHHGVKAFWSWVASWARCMGKPSDLGYSDDGFILPPLEIIKHVADCDITEHSQDGELFRRVDLSATSIHVEKRITSKVRAEKVAEIVATDTTNPWVIWVETDYDALEIMKRLHGAIEVSGSMKLETKEDRLIAFSTGNERILVTKPKIAGFGLNWQHCNNTVYASVNYSYEAFYQSVRRFWRFGQKRQVYAHVVMAETEELIWRVVQIKAKEHEMMKVEMVEAMKRETIIKGVKNAYNPTQTAKIPKWLTK